MEPRALGVCRPSPVEHGRKHASEKRSKLGVKGGLAPLGCLPLWGREGVILAIALSALWEGFTMKNQKLFIMFA